MSVLAEAVQVWMIIVACQAPNFTHCKTMQYIQLPDPLTCQKERIPASAHWKAEVRKQGFTDWEVFTRCQLVLPEKNGETG